MKEFRINKHIVLRLDDGKTNIFVNKKLFQKCKFLFLDIPINDIKKLDEVKSIDEAANFDEK